MNSDILGHMGYRTLINQIISHQGKKLPNQGIIHYLSCSILRQSITEVMQK